jgi:hypothetical protein
MPQGSAASDGSSGENISHFAAIRVRVTGTGNLLMQVSSLDNVKTKTLVPFTLQAANRIIPTRLVNFTEQRASFELKTSIIGEKFRINRIVVFMKEVASSYPGS